MDYDALATLYSFRQSRAVQWSNYADIHHIWILSGEHLQTFKRILMNIFQSSQMSRKVSILRGSVCLKTLGVDIIATDILIFSRDEHQSHILILIVHICEEEDICGDFKEGVIMTIFKKGGKSRYDNYRGATLPHKMSLPMSSSSISFQWWKTCFLNTVWMESVHLKVQDLHQVTLPRKMQGSQETPSTVQDILNLTEAFDSISWVGRWNSSNLFAHRNMSSSCFCSMTV